MQRSRGRSARAHWASSIGRDVGWGVFPPGLVSVTKYALRRLAIRILELTAENAEVSKRRRRLLTQGAPELMAIIGVGPDTATALMLVAGDNPDRLSSPAAFAALLGASPIEASSGKTVRMRLNRGGDRQGNSALWHIVISRMASHPQPRPTSNGAPRKACPSPRSSAASSATSPAKSSTHYPKKSSLDSRSITSRLGPLGHAHGQTIAPRWPIGVESVPPCGVSKRLA